MNRSFGIVENKVYETDFFLEKLKEQELSFKIDESCFYLSAFLSACRSITFALQSAMSGFKNFEVWYVNFQEELRKNQLARFFHISRNVSQKIGYLPVNRGKPYIDENGITKMKYFFNCNAIPSNGYVPEKDVVTACHAHFKNILKILLNVFLEYGDQIDPQLFYAASTSLSIEDVPDETNMNEVFIKYLGVDKTGK